MHLHQLNLVPLWLMTLLLALVLLRAMAAGMRLRRFVGTDLATVGSGQLIFGTMSILSLLWGLTFICCSAFAVEAFPTLLAPLRTMT